jgi:AcrR family transcriptional regulator
MSRHRFTRDQWLATALEVIASGETGATLGVRELAQRLGVSTGSFYWHFRGREDFVSSLVDYWGKQFTSNVANHVTELGGPAADRLFALMELLLEKEFARYDLAIRAWAARDPIVARQVRLVDRKRLRVVRSLFEELGFSDTELEVRTSTFVIYHSMELSFQTRASKKERRRQLRARHAFFVKP